MAIVWWKKVKVEETGRWEWVEDETTHVGLVMSPSWSKEERVMSDVYADVRRCRVWDPTKGETGTVRLGSNFENETTRGEATVDADPAVLAAWKAEEDRKAEAYRVAEADRLEAGTEARFKALLTEVKKGAEAVVVKGRKVPKGTRGVITWAGPGNYGPRVGIKDAQGTVHYTSESNIEVLLPGMAPGEVPEGGWRALHTRLEEEKSVREASYPKKGDRVRLSSGVLGYVFWAESERLGVKRVGAPRDEEPTWCNAWDVAVVANDGSERTAASAPAPDAARAPTTGFSDFGVGDEPEAALVAEPVPHPLADMPAPYCDIRTLKPEAESVFSAFDGEGNFLMKLPAKSAARITAMLGGA